MTNTKTSGTITIDGRAAQSLHVRVFDQDTFTLGPLSFNYRKTQLGETHTDNDGFYSVSYDPDLYGGRPDEDTVETKPASGGRAPGFDLRTGKYIPGIEPSNAEYGPGNPDLFIEVYSAGILRKISPIKQDVADDDCNIDLDIDSNAPQERTWLEVLGDMFVDGTRSVTDSFATLIAPVFGEALSTSIKKSGIWFRHEWEIATGRKVPIPNDLWILCLQRYQNLKREVLLRHFLPPLDLDKELNESARFIPYLVSEQAILGFRDKTKADAVSCDATTRYGFSVETQADQNGQAFFIHGERADLDWLKTFSDRTSDVSWADFRRHLPTYARSYENGLAYTGSFMGSIANEYALLPPDVDPQERVDCENIISLMLDTLEELETRGGLCGYLIRYDERGDSVAVGNAGKISCGFRPGMADEVIYCTPVGSRSEDSEVFKKEARFRQHEPSCDEYVPLIEGLAVVYSVLPSSSEVRGRARDFLARIHRYLQEHYFYLMRPCGNFTLRGPEGVWYEYPWSSFFNESLDVPPADEAPDSAEIYSKAGLGTPDRVYLQAQKDAPPLPVLVPTDLNVEVISDLVAAEVTRSNPNATACDRYSKYCGITADLHGQQGTPYFTLFMLAKSATLGKWCPAARQNLSDSFHTWFYLEDFPYAGGWEPMFNSWNTISMATAVSLDYSTSHILWERWSNFFGTERYIPLRRLRCEYRKGSVKTAENLELINDSLSPEGTTEADVEAFLNAKNVLISERGESGPMDVLWPVATMAHSIGKSLFVEPTAEEPETSSLGTMKVPDLIQVSNPAPAYLQNRKDPMAPDKDLTVRDLVNVEMNKRSARLKGVFGQQRPVFIVHPGRSFSGGGVLDLKSTLMFSGMVAARGADRVFVVTTPDVPNTDERANYLGTAIAEKMGKLRAEGKLPDLSFDLIGYSFGGMIARMLLLIFPSELEIYWPNNFVLIGTPNHGMESPPYEMPDLNQVAQSVARRKHHHDVRIFTCVGRIPGSDGDGLVSTGDAGLSLDEAVTIAEQRVIDNVLNAPPAFLPQSLPTLGLPWYFEDPMTIAIVLAWIEQAPSHIRCPYPLTAA